MLCNHEDDACYSLGEDGFEDQHDLEHESLERLLLMQQLLRQPYTIKGTFASLQLQLWFSYGSSCCHHYAWSHAALWQEILQVAEEEAEVEFVTVVKVEIVKGSRSRRFRSEKVLALLVG